MRQTFKYIIAILAAIIFICLGSIWASYFYLQTTHFTYTSSELVDEITFVILADLHDHEFGENNHKLISEVKESSPDAILMVGDMLNNISNETHVVVELTKQLCEIAPVYYVLGNHELAYMDACLDEGMNFLNQLAQAGAEILDKEYKDIMVNGQKIRIGGMYDYAFALDGDNTTNPEHMVPEVYEFLKDFQETDDFKLMLSHKPDAFIFGDAPKTWDIDLVISGHDHGGQVILPFVGGLFGGDQGWFPDYVYGMHSFEKYDMLITRGLGSNPKILPRFNNRPEVMVLRLEPGK